MPSSDLKGRIALITGSSAGIGREIAHQLARAGAHVVINGRTPERIEPVETAIRNGGSSASSCAADLLDRNQIRDMVDRTVAEHGRLDILVSSGAGATSLTLPWKLFHEMDEERILPIVHSYWLSKTYLIRAVLPHMIENNYGKIINLSSDAGMIPTTGESIIGASAAALQQMTRVIAREVGRYGIRINTVSCGPLVDNSPDEVEGYKVLAERADSGHSKVSSKLYSRRMFPVETEDVARTVLFLAGSDGDNITGQTWSVNGGMSMPP